MKIVNRQQFLQMPEGTVFCKFPIGDGGSASGMIFGIEKPSVLNATIYESTGNPIDFFATEIGSMTTGCCDTDHYKTLFEMRDNLGKEVSFEQFCERDGMFEDDNVGFAIFSEQEVQKIIDLLRDALEKGYNSVPKERPCDIYPVTIVMDRYEGAASGGKYLAFDCDPWDVPSAIEDADAVADQFWETTTNTIGRGETPQEALNDLCTRRENWRQEHNL